MYIICLLSGDIYHYKFRIFFANKQIYWGINTTKKLPTTPMHHREDIQSRLLLVVIQPLQEVRGAATANDNIIRRGRIELQL